MANYLIYTDGASSGNPGPSGWGAVILGAGRRREIGGFEETSTNNRMELTAAIEGLLRVPDASRVTVHSDSAYVIDGITRHILKWRRNGYIKSNKQPVENRDLWEKLDAVSAGHVHYVKVAAHSGNRENERANDIAQGFSQGRKVACKDAPFDPPAATRRRPDMPRGVSFPVYVVLTKTGPNYYQTWENCSKVVEGRRCRYKKCKSEEELAYILDKWGAAPGSR